MKKIFVFSFVMLMCPYASLAHTASLGGAVQAATSHQLAAPMSDYSEQEMLRDMYIAYLEIDFYETVYNQARDLDTLWQEVKGNGEVRALINTDISFRGRYFSVEEKFDRITAIVSIYNSGLRDFMDIPVEYLDAEYNRIKKEFSTLNSDIKDCKTEIIELIAPLYVQSVTLNSNGYATYSCRFDTKIATEGVAAYMATIESETIILTEINGYIPAGNGVILYGETAGATVEFDVSDLGSYPSGLWRNKLMATTGSDGTLNSFYLNYYPDEIWALGDGQEFLHYTGDEFVHNRAFLRYAQPAGSNAMKIVFEGAPTGVDSAIVPSTAPSGKFLQNNRIIIRNNGQNYNVLGQPVK